jgi:hypothetical protein
VRLRHERADDVVTSTREVRPMSYVVVRFPEPREVYIDDEGQGSNTAASGKPRALFVNAGKHTFRLSGAGVDPPDQTLNVPERPILNPYPVEFRKC